MNIARPSTIAIFFGENAWAKQQGYERFKKLGVEMKKVTDKFTDNMVKRLMGFCVLLPALRTIFSVKDSATVQTCFIMRFWPRLIICGMNFL